MISPEMFCKLKSIQNPVFIDHHKLKKNVFLLGQFNFFPPMGHHMVVQAYLKSTYLNEIFVPSAFSPQNSLHSGFQFKE